jgi:uncharacterized protein YjbI with pentapeptide repeats
MLAVWPTIEKTLGLGADDLSRFWVAICVAFTSGAICFLVYFVAERPLWDLLDLLIVPLAIAIIGLFFTAQQDTRQQLLEEQRAQNTALQAYLDQMNDLILDRKLLEVNKGVPVQEPGDPVHTLAQARTTTAITQFDGEHNQAVTRFLYESGLLREPALLDKAELDGAKLPNAVLIEANLEGTQLKGADLVEAELIQANFSAEEKVDGGTQAITADLTNADLSKAALQGANLSECHLTDADLTDATLQSADLSSADLQGVDLSHTALQGADLSPATIPGLPGLELPTDLTDANLTDANLTDADLSEAKGWTKEQLSAARSLEGATMPDGQILRSDGNPDGPTFEEWLKSKDRE